MTGSDLNNSNSRSAFASSSTDFALPFGTNARQPSSNSNNNGGAASGHEFFQSATASSAPISIPSSPSLSINHGQSVPMLSLSGIASSPSKLSTSGAGLGIGILSSPSARDITNPLAQSTTFGGPLQSPTLSLAGEGWPPPPFAGFASAASSSSSSNGVTTPAALLRRTPGMNSPGFAIASPARFRRASMLGREITPFQLDQEDRSEAEEQRNRSSSSLQYGMRADANHDPDDGDDEMMQVEDEDATASRAPNTPLMGPPLSLFNTPSTPPPTTSHLMQARPGMASLALGKASASDSGQDSSSSTGGNTSSIGLSRTVPRSPSTGPMGSPLGHGGNRSRSSSLLSSNVVRKAVTRRGNLLPRDRSVLRVAASLQDESKPEDSEIASEAKLQKRLGGEATLPRTPRFGPSSSAVVSSGGSSSTMRVARSPFFGAAGGNSGGGSGSLASGFSRRKYMWDDDVDDIRGVFTADGLDDGDSSDMSSEAEEMMMYYSRNDSLSDEEDELRSQVGRGTSILQDDAPSIAQAGASNEPNASSHGVPICTSLGGSGSGSIASGSGGVGSLPKRKNNATWMAFRDKGNAHKWSPGGAVSAAAAGGGIGAFGGERAAWRRAGAAGTGTGMDVDTSPRVLGAGSVTARLSKRKTMGDDRYEPYKRRAVSPMNLGSSLGTTPTNAAFGGAAVATASGTASAGGGPAAGSNSPLLMPISSPSSGLVYRGIHHHHHFNTYARYSTSPTISRPCTPVNSATAGAAAVAGAAFSPAGSGSGPGYGSGALGLSISANNPQSLESRVQAKQQQENEALMDQRVGMLGLS